MDFNEVTRWYDGYILTQFPHIYNPKSVTEALRRRSFSNYWTATETYEALKRYMDMDFDGLRTDILQMLSGGRVKINTRRFQNDMRSFKTMDDVLTLLIHLGYLGYDSTTKEAFIPNREIVEEFENAKKAIRVLGGKYERRLDFYLPDSEIYRNLFIIKKEGQTPLRFPRKAGIPSKEPIGGNQNGNK